jgi:hypothetical protein
VILLVFGIFIDVPLIASGFFIMFRFREKLAQAVLRVRLLL